MAKCIDIYAVHISRYFELTALNHGCRNSVFVTVPGVVRRSRLILIFCSDSVKHNNSIKVLEARFVSHATPLLCQRMHINEGNSRLTMPVLKGRGERAPLPEITMVFVFRCSKRNSTIMKHVNNESANFIDRYAVYIDISGLWVIVVGFGRGCDLATRQRRVIIYTRWQFISA